VRTLRSRLVYAVWNCAELTPWPTSLVPRLMTTAFAW
jgi:hypothetical protein